MNSLHDRGRSRYSKVLPDPPLGANGRKWQHLHQKPLPVPVLLSPGITTNSEKVNPLRSVTSVHSLSSLMTGYSVRSPSINIFRRHKNSRPPQVPDEEPPALSHSWSESSSNSSGSSSGSSSSIEVKDLSSSTSDPKIVYDLDPPSPPPADEKPQIILTDHLLNGPQSLFGTDKNNNNKYKYSNHGNHQHNHRDDHTVTHLNVPSTAAISESWYHRPTRINVHHSLIDLRSEHNKSSLREKRAPVVDQPSLPKSGENKRVLSITKEAPIPIQQDLMGNKLVKLKKSLGDLKSCSIYHDGDHHGLSAFRERKKTPLPTTTTTTTTTTTNVSSSFSSFHNEKSHDLLHPPASRDHSSKTSVSHSDPQHASSGVASSQSSGSTTRAPTIPSSEALTLRSESSMTAPPQPQPHLERHPPQHQHSSHPHLYSHPHPKNSHSNSRPHPHPHLHLHPHPQSQSQSPPHLSPLQTHPEPTAAPEFPTTPPVGEIIFPAPPLNVVQLECYQKHRSMRSSRNKVYPVGCMICQKIDTEMRWRCTWCCLSACEECNHKLSATVNKDLRSCLKQLGLQD